MPRKSWFDRWMTVHSSLLLLTGILSIYFFDLKLFFLGGAISFAGFFWQAFRNLPRTQLFTSANSVTVFRLGLTALLPLWLGNHFQLALIALLILCLDGLDGYLARRLNQSSTFGAWLDAETDAFFAATLSLLLYHQGVTGAWILLPGFFRFLYYLPVQFLRDNNQKPFRFPLAKSIAVLFLGALIAAWVLPEQFVGPVLVLASLAVLFSFWLEFRHDILVVKGKATPLLPGQGQTIFLFWGGFLFANGFLFTPVFLAFIDSGSLPTAGLENVRPLLDSLFINPANDLLRLCGEWVLLTIALYSVRTRPRLFNVVAVVGGLFFVLGLIFQTYQAFYFRLYGVPPKIEVDIVLIREVLPIFLSSIGADRFFNVAISIVSLLGMIFLYVVGYRFWLRTIRRLPKVRHIPFILCLLLLFAVLRIVFYHSNNAAPLSYRAQWLSSSVVESIHLMNSERLWSLGKKVPYRAYRDQNLSDSAPSVYLLFVEAYGAVATQSDSTKEAYSHLADSLESALSDGGWMAKSTYSHAPILGGRSWLSFTSGMCGIYIDNQIHYNNLIYSNPQYPHWPDVMNHLGYETYRMTTMRTNPKTDTLIPHDVLNQFWKFDHFIDYGQIPYQGAQSDNFGGIPDQYAMGYFRDSILPNTTDPHFLFFITMTSHTPWYPTPPVTRTWQELDELLPSPNYRQLEGDKVDRYFHSIEYELNVLTQHILQGPDNAIYILIGDHQPAALEYLLWGKFQEDAVPLHIISRDTSFLNSFADFDNGLHIDIDKAKIIRHEALYSIFMNQFLKRYSEGLQLPADQEFGVFPPDPLPDGDKIR